MLRPTACLFFSLLAVAIPCGSSAASEPGPGSLAHEQELIRPDALLQQFSGPKTAVISARTRARGRRAVTKPRFVRKADRICARQVPFYKKIEKKLLYFEQRYEDAVAAEDLEAAVSALRSYGQQVIKVANLLDKRKRQIKRLLPVRGKSPRHFIKSLHRVSRADRALGKSAVAVADDPTEENVARMKATYGPLDKATTAYFKAGKGYGFRKCSKPLAEK